MTNSADRRPHWVAGETPWVRRTGAQRRHFRCMFCGDETAILSANDHIGDYGRVEVYCDSPECDAREVVLLIRRGEGANRRADVRALAAVDKSVPYTDPEPEPVIDEYDAEHLSEREIEDAEIQRRRWQAANDESDPVTRRRLSRVAFRIDVQ